MPERSAPTDDARLRIVFDAAANAMLIVDDEPRILTANVAAAELLRTPAADLAGLPLAGIPAPDAETTAHSWALVRRNGRGHMRIPRDGGRDIEVGLHLVGEIGGDARLVLLEPIGLPGAGILTPRQRDTLRLLCDGATNQQIALALGVSDPTVQKHIVGIKERLGAATRAQVVALALQQDDLARRIGSERLYVHEAIRDAARMIVDTRLLYVSHATRREMPEIIPHVGQRMGSWYPDYARSPLLALIARAVDSGRSAYADRILVAPPWGRPGYEIDAYVTPIGPERAMFIGRVPIAPVTRGARRATP